MASKISLYIAIFLYILSLCIPAAEDTLGITVIFMAILGHILLIGIPFAFPAWANVTFYFAIQWYFKSLKSNDSTDYDSGAALALLTVSLMLIGIFIKFSKLNAGAVIWLVSGVFLLLAFLLKKLKPRLANVCLIVIILSCFIAAIYLYVKEKDVSKYQLLRYPGIHQYLFKEKESEMIVPDLVQVIQNHPTRLKATGKRRLPIDKNAIDLAMLQGERIEIDFDEVVYPKLVQGQKALCQLQPHQQYVLQYPKRYWEEGYEWHHQSYLSEFVIGESKPNSASIIYRSQRLDEQHSLVQLIRKSDQKILYEQKLLAVPFEKGCRYSPDLYASELKSVFDLLFDDRPSFEERYAALKAIPEYKETLTTGCTWQKEKPNQYIFEGRKIRFTSEQIVEPQLLCSEHYIAVGYMTRTGNKYTPIGEFGMHIFQRNSLELSLCSSADFEMSAIQQQAYEKGDFKLDRLVLMDRSRPQSCRRVEAHFNDKTVQVRD